MARKPTTSKQSKAARSKLPNLANLVKRAAMARGMPSDEELARLALLLIYETPDDLEHHAVRTRAKLDAMRFLHELNQDNKADTPTESTEDAETLELLRKRSQP